MKLRVALLMLAGAAGVGASFALADGGHVHHGGLQAGTSASCERGHLSGTVSSPQTFTVTVTKSGEHGSFAPGQVVTVSVGSAGQAVRVNVEGCANGSSLTAGQAELHAVMPPATTSTATTSTGDHHGDHHGDGDHHGATTQSTTTTKTTTTTAATTTSGP
jgi:hypothetical protein